MLEVGKLIGEGRTAEIFELHDNKVLKLFRKGISGRLIKNEYNISKMLSENNFSVAKTYELVTYEDRHGIIYERIYGSTMMKNIALKPLRLQMYTKKFAELHYQLHKDVDADMLGIKDKLLQNIKETDLLDARCKEKLEIYISNLPDGNTLLHGDYHPDNILMADDKDYIIDWMTATKGNSLSDVARTVVMLKYAILPDSIRSIEKYSINFLRKKLLNQYLKQYIKFSGCRLEEIQMWELPIAAARLVEWISKEEKELLVQFIYAEIDKIKV